MCVQGKQGDDPLRPRGAVWRTKAKEKRSQAELRPISQGGAISESGAWRDRADSRGVGKDTP